jgi:hypothetical protein
MTTRNLSEIIVVVNFFAVSIVVYAQMPLGGVIKRPKLVEPSEEIDTVDFMETSGKECLLATQEILRQCLRQLVRRMPG